MSDDTIPIIEIYRGVGVHDCQPPERIELVKAAIDDVYGISDLKRLCDYAGDITRPPEARLLAAAKCEATFQIAADESRKRPVVNLDLVRASVAGLSGEKWRSPREYCSLLDVPHAPGERGPERRETPLR